MGLNPGTKYWRDVINASYYIQEINEEKVAKRHLRQFASFASFCVICVNLRQLRHLRQFASIASLASICVILRHLRQFASLASICVDQKIEKGILTSDVSLVTDGSR
jgi:hypothetical protein